jgi:putative DNA primase/helicase
MIAATKAYFDDQDLFGQWLEDSCDVNVESISLWDRSADLYRSWSQYCEGSGEDPGSAKRFAEMLKKRGFNSRRTGSARGFQGVRLKPDAARNI